MAGGAGRAAGLGAVRARLGGRGAALAGLAAFAVLALVITLAWPRPGPSGGPADIDTDDPARIAALVARGVIPPGLPPGARLRARWGDAEPVREAWFHVTGGTVAGLEGFARRLRPVEGSVAGLSRIGPPEAWESFSLPARQEGVILRERDRLGAVVWHVEIDRLNRIRGRLATAAPQRLRLVR